MEKQKPSPFNLNWLPFRMDERKPYADLTNEEKLLRHMESIDRNVRFFSWIMIVAFVLMCLVGLALYSFKVI